MEKILYEEMFRMEERHWWFAGRRQIILALFRYLSKKIKPPPPKLAICDIGTGCGIMLWELKKNKYYEAKGIDRSEAAMEFCRQRGVTVIKGSLPEAIPFPPNSFDVVFLLDVLEHIEKDREAVESVFRILRDKGLLLVTVPAYPWLWTKRDEFHGHKRRYTRGLLQKLFPKEKWRIILLSHFNTFLFLPAAGLRILQKKLGLDRYAPDLFLPKEPLNTLFRTLFASEGLFLPYFSFPLGLSIILAAWKKAS